MKIKKGISLKAERLFKFVESRPMSIILFVILVLVIFISYNKVPFLFVQQDEILGFGLFVKEGRNIILRGLSAGNITHFIPVTMSLSFSIYSFFGLKYWIYNIICLIFHLFNGYLVFLIAKKILKSKFSQFISVIIFFSSSVATELVMWPVINLNVLSLTFSLLAWLVVIDESILQKVKGFLRGLIVTVLFLLSVFSVEYSGGFIIFLPVAYFILKKDTLKKKLIFLSSFLFLGFTYLLIRLLPIIFQKNSMLSFAPSGDLPIYLRWIKLVPRYFGQLFFDQSIILSFSKMIGKIFGLGEFGGINEVFIEKNIFPVVALILGLAIIFISLFIFKKILKEKDKYSIHFILIILLIALSSLPFLMVPGEAGSFTIFSSRYMYFGLTGMAIYFGFINDILVTKRRVLYFILVVIFTIAYILSGTIKNFKKGEEFYKLSLQRRGILEQIAGTVDGGLKEIVIYTESDRSYYGLPDEDRILPFQSGLGQTLLIFLSQKQKFPIEFYPGYYLWEIDSQGYERIEDRGFGYFRDKKLLKNTIKTYNISKESIFAFSWDGQINQLTNISDKIRREVYSR